MLKQQIAEAMKICMKAKMKIELTGLRMLNAAIKNKEIDLKRELTDTEIIAVIKKQVKEHKDSLSYIKDQTSEDAIAYKTYITTLENFLPEEMPEEEIKARVKKIVSENNLSGMSNMGALMKICKIEFAGESVDMSLVSKIVREILI